MHLLYADFESVYKEISHVTDNNIFPVNM